ncbi:MAG: class I SAM-dependent methyltransferase [Nitrospirae bacterium]|nr:MAG: class I SAM-dependent methyltransferase [Nitrospirota bacterium]
MEWHRLYGSEVKGTVFQQNEQGTQSPKCPVCSGQLVQSDAVYSVDELFTLWSPIRFSPQTIEEHRRQSPSTALYACDNCRLEIFLPPIIGTPQFYVESYNLFGAQGESAFGYSADKWDFDEAIKDVEIDHAVIEMGCGPGNFLAKVRPHVSRVAGAEYNTAAIDQARAKGLSVVPFDEAFLTCKAEFDRVFAFHVLEHVEVPLEFLARLRTLLKPRGKIGISVPNQDGPIAFIHPCIHNMPPHHATRWRLRTLEAAAQRLGMKIERVSYEPLLLENHSYYSWHWVHDRFGGPGLWRKWFCWTLSRGLQVCFMILLGCGLTYFRPLRGQSIYVLLAML